MASTSICGVTVPDSKIAREATELLRDVSSDLLFEHSLRVYFWGAIAGNRKKLIYDPELLYVGAMFHDFGLTPGYRTSQLRFEVDGANAARDFLESHGIGRTDIDKVWAAIALHTTPGIPHFMDAEIALLHAATGMDVAGRGYADFTPEEREAVTAAYPRGPEFEAGIIDEFYAGLKHRPDSTFGTLNEGYLACRDPEFRPGNICSVILTSPWTCGSLAPDP
ncbi:HD domain-containing protein [Sphingomonas cannabina]|uniref:HD domain-containing protein n=1 Tax=Sphingomonas cannabina TaxID=2899123 RepID=UPI001F2ED453|nr:HD domain-containing protein [Sphingomonas cannabina]UIJ44756.1 HD domain-containing protein [Sphingomonas cannabina]